MSQQREQDIFELQTVARRAAIERAEKEYKLHCDVYETADRKAQATTTIAGALLAADLGFVARLSERPSIFALTMLLVITIALGASVLLALWAMYVRDTEIPAIGPETVTHYDAILRQPSPESFERAERLFLDFLLKKLGTANESVSSVGARKAGLVHRAQQALIGAAFGTILLTLALIFNPNLLALKATAESAPGQPSTAQPTPKS
ncbi:hypothetical protein AWB80_01164 [Caballeronia pedi]|uniref:Pycsar effector protein domain-containing protein n=1 Tax=Caballeronia pedi TaxID=1777141 RepID=A0A157ZR05_9BURK|nr:hypothetical protein [Caballeronia pedi]SAK47950.1 hypothetical protein AWB80_01164 [Caballeronia pedi]